MIIDKLSIQTKIGRKLINNLSFVINPGDRLAIIGEEGDGKSTLIKALANPTFISDYAVISGQVNIETPIGYLTQFLDHEWDNYTVMDYFLKESPLAEPDYDVFNEYSEIIELFPKFGLNPKMLESNQLIGTLSGGEKVKLQLIKISKQKPAIYLLDEPTNDIDIETLEILENFIKKQKVPVIFVSHDETFIENCANCILHFEQIKRKTEFKYTFFKGSFLDYVESRKRSLIKQDQIAKLEETRYNNKMETINRLIEAGAGDKVVKRLIAQRERMEKKGLPEYVDIESAMGLFFNEVDFPNSKVVLDLEDRDIYIGDQKLIVGANIHIVGPEKVVIIGNNGVGKTTLLKAISKELEHQPGIKLGYMPQNYSESMNMDSTPIEFLCPFGDKEQKTYCYTLMGISKFTSEEMRHKIKNLSGGQQAKLYILKMIIDKSNVLILDEPTRNLSPLSSPVIREILKDYGGAIISVSHDRKYISEVCDTIYEIKDKKLEKKTVFNEQEPEYIKILQQSNETEK